VKVVGIIGYRNSGKTTLILNLSQELARRGWKVAILKHTRGALDVPHKDTARHMEHAHQVAAISPKGSAIFFKGKRSLEDMLGHLDADFVIIEGMKEEKIFPKVVCLKEKKGVQDLFDGLEICAATLSPLGLDLGVPVFHILDDVKKIADMIVERAFKLPNLNCGACGYERCYDLAREICKGRKEVKDCVSLNPSTEVLLGGKALAMNPFVAKIVRGAIKGMLSGLKGFKRGKIEIRIDRED